MAVQSRSERIAVSAQGAGTGNAADKDERAEDKADQRADEASGAQATFKTGFFGVVGQHQADDAQNDRDEGRPAEESEDDGDDTQNEARGCRTFTGHIVVFHVAFLLHCVLSILHDIRSRYQ